MEQAAGGTDHDGAHPLPEDEGSVELLEEAEEEAVRLRLLAVGQLHAAEDVQPVVLEGEQDRKTSYRSTESPVKRRAQRCTSESGRVCVALCYSDLIQLFSGLIQREAPTD